MCCFCAGMAARKVSTLARIGSSLQVIADDLGNERIDPLVVGHAGPERVGQADLSRAIRRDQAGDAELAVSTERERVEEVVVDPPVDHVDPLRSRGSSA